MSRIIWGASGSRIYQAGISRGVYFNSELNGMAWNGLVSVVESEPNKDAVPLYLDGRKIINRRRFGEFLASLEVITAPGDDRTLLNNTFSFSYRVEYGNHYEIHLVYNATAVLGTRGYVTIDDAPELTLLALNISTLPQVVDTHRRTSHLIINSLVARSDALAAFEAVLYGDSDHNSRLPSPDEVLEIFESHAILRVTELSDGSYRISGPDDVIFENIDGSWTIVWDSVIEIYDSVYQISSL